MTLKPQVTFRNMEKVRELGAAVGKEAGGLDRFFDTRQHEAAPRGTVTELSPEGGFGFLEAEGRGVYFHRNSVLAGQFDRLRIGSRVRFADEAGEKGAQAIPVRNREGAAS
jgi:cold shock CspA family protein